MFYGINTMVVAYDFKLIVALNEDWHGTAHDAHVWSECRQKCDIESRRDFLLAGDSAYPISDVLMKPYLTAAAIVENRNRLFNACLCGLRTELSGNVFGIFPILRNRDGQGNS
jgi:hypothetical protein